MAPTLTIAIPVYERTFGFDEALASAIAVKECNEILVVDDCSSHDEFRNICSERNDPRIHYKRNHQNLGIFGNWNRCAELATSEFIAILCSDDVIEQDIFQRFKIAFSGAPDIDVFFGPFVQIDVATNEKKVENAFHPGRISAQWLLEDAVNNKPCFPVLSVIRRKKLYEFPFVARPHSGNDWLWIYSNALHLNLYADAKPLSYWRRHPDQDAKKSQSITTDCWPLMFINIAQQLEKLQSPKAAKAKRRATGVVLSWLLNDRHKHGKWCERLVGEESSINQFLTTAKDIADKNWLLSKLLYTKTMWPLYYQLGRFTRKAKIYQPGF